MTRQFSFAVLVLGHVAACGAGTDSDPGGPATQADITASCAGSCGWKQRCNKNPATNCQQSCEAEWQSKNYWVWQSAYIQSYASCMESLSCSFSSDDSCSTQAMNTVAPNWVTNPGYVRCKNTRENCKSAGQPTFIDDNCYTFMALVSDKQALFLSCLDQSCAAMKSCVEGVFK